MLETGEWDPERGLPRFYVFLLNTKATFLLDKHSLWRMQLFFSFTLQVCLLNKYLKCPILGVYKLHPVPNTQLIKTVSVRKKKKKEVTSQLPHP